MSEKPWNAAEVECYSGGKLDETPRAFRTAELRAQPLTLLASQLERDGAGEEWRVFTVSAELGEIYLLRQCHSTGAWEVQISSARGFQ